MSKDGNSAGSENGTTGDEGLEGKNLHDLDNETLDSLNVGDDGTIQRVQAEPDGEAGDESTKKTGDEESTTKPDGKSPDPETPGHEGTIDGEGGEDGQPKGDPLKDTQKAFHEKSKALKQAEEKIRKLTQEIRELKEPQKPKNYNLSEEELERLRVDNPDGYIEAVQAKKDYDRDKEDYDRQIKDAEEEELKLRQDAAAQDTIDSVIDFAVKVVGIEDGKKGKPWDDQPEELQEFYKSEKFQELISFVEANPKKFYEDDGSISADTLRMVWRDLHFDDLAKNERVTGRQETVEKIKRAAAGGSPFDRVPQEKGGRTAGTGKTLDKLTQAEIHDMSEEELASYEPEIDFIEEEGAE